MAADKAALQFFAAVKLNRILEATEFLKNKLVDVDARDPTFNDNTALHIAAKEGLAYMTRMLIDEYKATVNIKNAHGKIPLQVATDVNNMNIVKLLLERNSDLRVYAEPYLNDAIVDELFTAAEFNDIPTVVKLVKEQKVDVDSIDKSNHRKTILQIAATNGYEEMVRVLVDELHANIQSSDDFGDTPKHMAMDNSHPNIVKFLIDRGYKDRF